ncbi:MAG: hypothetical protein GX127_04095 [Eubacteriaceae bacterium]|jgi:hypothetical protein|nr:hypothetical protein [Eubacteriaceae bacterium]
MLAKLIKLEFKSTYQKFLPLYLTLFVFIVMGVINLNYGLPPGESIIYDSFNALLTAFYVLSLIAVVVVTGVLIVMRFYKNFLTDQGYLIFTLPATVEQHVLAKLIVAFVWTTLSTCALLLSLLALFSTQVGSWNNMLLTINQGYEMALFHMGDQFHSTLIIIILYLIISPISSTLMYYLAMSFGQLSRTHKILTSIGAYLAISIVLQLVSSLFASLFMPKYYQIMETTIDPTVEMAFSFMNSTFIFSLLLNIALAVGSFFLVSYLLKNKLNLE